MADDGEFCHVCCLGYIFRVPKQKLIFPLHKGRDITARQIRQFHGLPLDENDDMGQPPFPNMDHCSEDEREFVYSWFDFYFQFSNGSDPESVVGFLAEWPKEDCPTLLLRPEIEALFDERNSKHRQLKQVWENEAAFSRRPNK